MFPLIWDFGTLDSDTEKKYVRQMIQKLVNDGEVAKDHGPLLLEVLSTCQRFMRGQTDECSFVSLRDVERTLKVLAWFQEKSDLDVGYQATPDYGNFSTYLGFDQDKVDTMLNAALALARKAVTAAAE